MKKIDSNIKAVGQKKFDYSNATKILEVKNLKQYFKGNSGPSKYFKVVHDLSFDIYKGEVFGLVGESGCGKTTTGRTIMKLYKPTSGDIIFDGVRISAGTRWNEKEIKFTNLRLKAKLKELDKEYKEELKTSSNKVETKAKYAALKKEEIEKANKIVTAQRQEILNKKNDLKNYNKELIETSIKEVSEKYKDLISKYNQDSSSLTEKENELYKLYLTELKKAKNAKITNKMQMIFQDPIASLNPRMTVKNIIAEGLIINGIKDDKYITQEVNRVLECVGLLPEHANRYPHEFSGGQRQRIGIARAIIMNPELIIADEPVSALDVSIQAQIINLLNNLRNTLNLSILFIAHNLSVVKYFCDRIAVMYMGEIKEIATSDELFEHPLHPYTKSLLSAVPFPDPNEEKDRTRVMYNPAKDHDYSNQKPTLREIAPGHFVSCNDKEETDYRKVLNGRK